MPAFPRDQSDTFMVPFIQQFLASFVVNHPEVELLICPVFMPKGTPYVWNNIEVIPLNIKNNNLFQKLFSVINTIKKVIKIAEQNKVSGILSFWYTESALIGNIVAFFCKKPHFIWLQGQDVKRTNKYMKYFRPNPNKLIALSQFQNDFLFNEFNFKAKTIAPIIINPSLFPELNTEERTIDILGAGSLIAIKNYDLFIDVIAEIKKSYPNVKVALAGNGTLKNHLKKRISELNLENTISLLGLLQHKASLEYMNKAKIFLHTSSFEGGGAVTHEALYSGCKVVCTLPLVEKEDIPFFYRNSKEEIVVKLKKLLAQEEPIKRELVNESIIVTKTIYDLFFTL